MTTKFEKLYIALKFRLKGMGFYEALRALEYGRELHSGTRKDGCTPEFQHQIEIALYIMTLKDVQDLEGTIIAALLHDAAEDYPHKVDNVFIDSFGSDIALSIRRLNKKSSATPEAYFAGLAKDIRASLVKGVDRINNFQSMNRGKFKIEKQKSYAYEVVTYFLPMLKTARKTFAKQMDAYYNIENMLKSQHELITLFIEASESTVAPEVVKTESPKYGPNHTDDNIYGPIKGVRQ